MVDKAASLGRLGHRGGSPGLVGWITKWDSTSQTPTDEGAQDRNGRGHDADGGLGVAPDDKVDAGNWEASAKVLSECFKE